MHRVTSSPTSSDYSSDDPSSRSPSPSLSLSGDPGQSSLPHAHLSSQQGRANVHRMINEYHVDSASEASDASDAEAASETSDEDEFEKVLLDLETEPQLYQPGEAGAIAQLSYLSRYANNATGLSEMSYPDFYSYWDQLHAAENITTAEMDQGAQGSEITESGRAVGSQGAASCLLAFAKATVSDHGRQRTYAAVIHLDPATLDISTMDPMQMYTSVLKPLNAELLGLDARISSKEYFFLGGSNDESVPASLRLCAATLHAARGFQIRGCLIPTNNAHQATNAILTKEGLHFCKTNF